MRRRGRFAVIAFAGLCVAGGAIGETMYKSITPDGRVIFSDRPPANARVEKTMTYENLPATALPAATSSALEQLKRSRPAASPVVSSEGVVLYSAAWCGYCTRAKAYLADKRIAFREIDIDTDDGKLAYAQAGGGKGVPLLIVGGQRIQGFSGAAYDEVFSRRR